MQTDSFALPEWVRLVICCNIKWLAGFGSNSQSSQLWAAFISNYAFTHLSTTTSTSSVPTSHHRLLCKVRNTTNANAIDLLNPATHDLSVIAMWTFSSLWPNPRLLRRTYTQAGMSYLSGSIGLRTQTHCVQTADLSQGSAGPCQHRPVVAADVHFLTVANWESWVLKTALGSGHWSSTPYSVNVALVAS